MEMPASPLARFAVEGGRLKASAVKPKMFEPNRQLELSVFRTGSLLQEEIQEIGLQVVRANPNASHLHGWAEIGRGDVESTGLRIIDDDDPPRHSNVVGWPGLEDRDKMLELKQSLASMAKPHLLKPPIVA